MSKTPPLVSVIIPTYNAAPYLPEAVSSALAQTYKNIEVVIVDDGSTDRTKEALRDYLSDNRVRYISEPHKGLPAARNTAIRNSRGEYVALLDADDIFLPEKIERQVVYLEINSSCDVSYSGIYHFFDDKPEELFRLKYQYYSGTKVFPNLLRYFFIAPLSVVLRRSFFDRFGYFDETIPVAEDLDFWLHATYRGARVCFLPDMLGKLRLRNTGNIQELERQPELKEMALKSVEKLNATMPEADRVRYHMRFYLMKYRLKVAFAHFLAGEKKSAEHYARIAFAFYPLGSAIGSLASALISISPLSFLRRFSSILYKLRRLFIFERVTKLLTSVPPRESLSAKEEKHPLVSVVVPVYNAEAFVEETIRSVLRQTYDNFEVIVVDDGSKDRTREIVERTAKEDRRVTYVFQKNAGQSAARNTAIRNAKGKYIAFLDADDLFLPRKLELQVAHLEHNPDCGVSYSKIYHFFDTDTNQLFYFDVGHPSSHLFEKLLHKNFINPLSVVLRKELLDRYGVFEHSFRRVDEQYLWLKLSYHKVKFCYLDQALGYYRIHRKSLSNEAVYFKETEERFLDLLNIVRSWMTKEELRKYNFERLVVKRKFRLVIGRLMAAPNLLGRFLFFLYNVRRNLRLSKISEQ